MRIVAADPTDAAAVALIRALGSETQRRYPGEPVFGIDAEGFAARGGIFLLGFVAGSPIACGALRPIDDGVFEIKRMYLRDEFRGRGLSRLMYDKLEMMARDAGCHMLRIETGCKQPEALGLYRSVGFAETPRFGPYSENEYSMCFAKCVPGTDELKFLRDFEACQLPEAGWTHLAHIHMAWLYLTQFDCCRALEKIRTGIKRFNAEVLGRPEEYHVTVTVAFTCIVSDRIVPGEAWTGFNQRIDDMLMSNLADTGNVLLERPASLGTGKGVVRRS